MLILQELLQQQQIYLTGQILLLELLVMQDYLHTITSNITGNAGSATTLTDAANITTGTISDARLPDTITSNINVTSGVSTFVEGSIF